MYVIKGVGNFLSFEVEVYKYNPKLPKKVI